MARLITVETMVCPACGRKITKPDAKMVVYCACGHEERGAGLPKPDAAPFMRPAADEPVTVEARND